MTAAAPTVSPNNVDEVETEVPKRHCDIVLEGFAVDPNIEDDILGLAPNIDEAEVAVETPNIAVEGDAFLPNTEDVGVVVQNTEAEVDAGTPKIEGVGVVDETPNTEVGVGAGTPNGEIVVVVTVSFRLSSFDISDSGFDRTFGF